MNGRQITPQPINLSANDARKVAAGEKVTIRRVASGRMRDVRPGTLLWVREPFYLPARFDGRSPLQASSADPRLDLRFAAHWSDRPAGYGGQRYGRTLPKPFSRMTLRVALVETQRLQDIDDAGARREGYGSCNVFAHAWDRAQQRSLAIGGGDRWKDNPFVTVLTFAVEHENILTLTEPAREIA